jgi:glycosyltransferase involved in cell wall biosynthesis
MISVIIPCYNYGHLLAETLESLLRQTEHGWEALIIDSASADETANIAKSYSQKDKRFKYFYTEKGGVSRSRNIGLDHASGELIQFLDADDLLQPHKFQNDLLQFQRSPEADAVYSTPLFFAHPNPATTYSNYKLTNETQHPYIINSTTDRDALTNKILSGNIFAINSLCVRKSSLDDLRFNESIGQNEDWLFWCTAVLRGLKFQYYDVPDSKALIRVHANSVSQNECKMLVGGMIVTTLLAEMAQKPSQKKLLRKKLLGQRHRLLSLIANGETSFNVAEINHKDLERALTHSVAEKLLHFTKSGGAGASKKMLKFELLKLRIALKLL